MSNPSDVQENTGTSLLEAFSDLEVKTHLKRLREAAVGSTRDTNAVCNPNNQEACSACGIVRLAFEPAAIFCSSCNQRIKKNQVGSPLGRGLGFYLCCGKWTAECIDYTHWRMKGRGLTLERGSQGAD